LFGIDGFLTKCFVPNQFPGFTWLLNKGSYTFQARTSIYSISAPGWSNIMCAQSSEETGITDNDWWAPWVNQKPYPVTPISGNSKPIPCVFKTIKENNINLRNVAIFTWDWLLNFGNETIPNSIDEEFICKSNSVFEAIICDEKAYNKTIEIIKKKESTLKFANVSDLMYHYMQGDLGKDKKFIYYLEKIADDQ
ncbi:MAG: alkaline phosphatase family protein, partial [Flammeovirgaceae bacterium]